MGFCEDSCALPQLNSECQNMLGYPHVLSNSVLGAQCIMQSLIIRRKSYVLVISCNFSIIFDSSAQLVITPYDPYHTV